MIVVACRVTSLYLFVEQFVLEESMSEEMVTSMGDEILEESDNIVHDVKPVVLAENVETLNGKEEEPTALHAEASTSKDPDGEGKAAFEKVLH